MAGGTSGFAAACREVVALLRAAADCASGKASLGLYNEEQHCAGCWTHKLVVRGLETVKAMQPRYLTIKKPMMVCYSYVTFDKGLHPKQGVLDMVAVCPDTGTRGFKVRL